MFPVSLKLSSSVRFRFKRYCTKATEERSAETLTSDNDEVYREETHRSDDDDEEKVEDGGSRRNVSYWSDALNLGIREPVYEVCDLSF